MSLARYCDAGFGIGDSGFKTPQSASQGALLRIPNPQSPIPMVNV